MLGCLPSHRRLPQTLFAIIGLTLAFVTKGAYSDDAGTLAGRVSKFVQRYCVDCHGDGEVNAGISLSQMVEQFDLAVQFKSWEKVAEALNSRTMPPSDSEQPSPKAVREIVTDLRTHINRYSQLYAGDPGAQMLRRLTSAEYGHSIEDLTGLRLGLERTFVNEGVGGEGFTNAGIAQFMDDAALERYLEAAKIVANHAVIGAGPMMFFADPGETGKELSAIHRIIEIYRRHGFRTGAGEGAEPYGLDLYPQAFYVAWLYQFRAQLGNHNIDITELARREGISPRLCAHIWQVLNQPTYEFPLSMIVHQWKAIAAPGSLDLELSRRQARQACDQLGKVLREWQSMLAAAAGDEEEASVLTSGIVSVSSSHRFKADINWARGSQTAKFELSVTSASQQASAGAVVIWKSPSIQFRSEDNRRHDFQPLAKYLSASSQSQLAMGIHPRGASVGPRDFVLRGDQTMVLELAVPLNARAAQLTVDVELDTVHGDNRIVRCRIADGSVEGETAAEFGATSTLLADPQNSEVQRWSAGVANFARLLPEVSQREPAPSDRDPIPLPFDNTYNKPERNYFHTAIKYHRDDQFLVEKILDDATRTALDQAWTDLLTSFDYHSRILQFVSDKYKLPKPEVPQDWADAELARLPDEVRTIVKHLLSDLRNKQLALQNAQSGHVDDVLRFAERAWRQPLSHAQSKALREFYDRMLDEQMGDHSATIRTLLARILCSPDFIYHTASIDPQSIERDHVLAPIGRLTDRAFVNRLSFFLWSTLPDDELIGLATSSQIRQPAVLRQQLNRMLRDEKTGRFAEEFFGQWLGFYRFDEFRGIDAGRFPEFTDHLRADLYSEAIAFFEHILREDRPVSEILFADYTFASARLAQHYGLPHSEVPDNQLARIEDVQRMQRGGVLGLGALHAVTSAPLRTSAVKRGDWVLRRLLNSPVPPPPADAGSISADEVHDDGLTVRRRLEAHRTQAVCASCHSRIDPLGFALENFDPIGRWRDLYRDGQSIDVKGKLHDGMEIDGPRGLRNYLLREQPKFERTLATKLLGYALGRSELASDQPLIGELAGELRHRGRLSDVIFRIVTSKQFNYRRWEPNIHE